MRRSDTSEYGVLKVYVLLGAMLLSLVFLGVVLWHVQVAHGAEYERDLRRQSIRRVRLPGTRGCIYDRSGVCLVENRPSYCIAIYLEELKYARRGGRNALVARVDELVNRLSQVLGMERQVTAEQIEEHLKRRSPLPLLAWRDVGQKAIAALVESGGDLPGVDVYLEPVRVYTQGKFAAHVLRHVGRAEMKMEDSGETYHYYLPEMEGRRGIERAADDILRGSAGGNLIRVDAMGFKRSLPGDKEVVRDPTVGSDVKLTIDSRIQRLAEKALEGEVGAVVVLDPRNGDVLAMASAPSFSPNIFATGMSRGDWYKLLSRPHSPLLNKATSGAYTPGSIFKLVVAAAALEKEKGITAATAFQCPGYYDLGKKQLRCWIFGHGEHGLIGMRKAIEQSCNVYFCNLGARVGYEKVYRTGLSMGLGRPAGIELDGEAGGQLPRPDRIRSKGDIANVSIGQGAVLVTPLQMAVVAATVANGGYLYRPRLVLGLRRHGEEAFALMPPCLERDMKWSQATVEVLRGGMLDVVHSPSGTGKRALIEGVKMGGKTGTAQYGNLEDEKKRGWMLAFAPFDSPRYVVSFLLEDAVSGGRDVAPKVRELMMGILQERGARDGSG